MTTVSGRNAEARPGYAPAGATSGAARLSEWIDRHSGQFFITPAVVLIPGLLLLVPGSLGLRSVDLMMGDEFMRGMEAAFSTALTAVSLVAGLLVANAALPPVGTARERHPTSPTFAKLTRLIEPIVGLPRGSNEQAAHEDQ